MEPRVKLGISLIGLGFMLVGLALLVTCLLIVL